MTYFRDFSSSNHFQPPYRSIDSDAPQGMRHELIDLIFHIVEINPWAHLKAERIYNIICQSLGTLDDREHYGDFSYAASLILEKADWPRVYDVITRLWPNFFLAEVHEQYRNGVNRILSGYKIVWELNENGRFRRVVPPLTSELIGVVISELSDPRFAPALELVNAATAAFDDHPQRGYDACSNIFKCMESVAKEVFQMPTATFGEVLKTIKHAPSPKLTIEVIRVLEQINALRGNKLGHGMTEQFNLSTQEIDFVYMTCFAAIHSLVRI